jgi:lipooligosaccharide transport system permease protein
MNAAAPSRVRSIAAVLRRHLRVWRRLFVSHAVGSLVEPLVYLVAFGFGLGMLVPDVGGRSYLSFLAPGLIVSSALYAATFEGTYGTYTRLVPQRTFEGMLATPVSVAEVVIGEALYAGLKGTFAGCAVLLVATAFGLMESPWALAVPALCALGALGFAGISVLVSGISRSYDAFNYYFTLGITPLFMFSGIFFPLDRLPEWVRVASWFNPVTHAVEAMRAACYGEVGPRIMIHIGALLLFAVLPLPPAVRLIRRRLMP